MTTLHDYMTEETAWCPGCGNFGIRRAFAEAMIEMDIEPHQLMVVSGIGQAAKFPHYIACNTFNGLHGRALPVATGIRLANNRMTVVVETGDGDCYGEGGNHFMHAVRRNIDLTVLAHNNMVYGLTKGQASPTSERGMVTRIQQHGVIQEPFNPLTVALALKASFVSRGFSGNIEHLSMLIQEGMKHKGLSLIDIFQPCVSFNHVNTNKWYSERVYDVAKENYNPKDYDAALKKAREWGDRIPIGIIYKEEKPSFTDQIYGLKNGPLVDRKYSPETLRELLKQI